MGGHRWHVMGKAPNAAGITGSIGRPGLGVIRRCPGDPSANGLPIGANAPDGVGMNIGRRSKP